jgi:K+-sensing histidine kinase KdpD
MSNQLSDIRSAVPTIFLPLCLVATVTPALIALEPVLPSNLVWLCYLMPVVLVSVRWGFMGAATTAVIAGVTADFFFTRPYYSLWMEDPRDVVALVLFLAAGFGSAALITTSGWGNRRQSGGMSDLHQFVGELSNCRTSDDVIGCLRRWISSVARGRLTVLDALPDDIQGLSIPEEIRRVAAAMCATRYDAIRVISTNGTRLWFLKQLRFDDRIHGTLVVETGIDACDRKLTEAALEKAAIRFCELARSRSLMAKAESLSDSGLGRQWRTSLTIILGAVGVLQMDTEIADSHIGRILLADIEEEAVHLSSLLGDAFSVS